MKLNKEERFIRNIIIIVVIGLLIRAYGLHVRNQTIRAAELTAVTENGYTLSFEGEEHYYTFED